MDFIQCSLIWISNRSAVFFLFKVVERLRDGEDQKVEVCIAASCPPPIVIPRGWSLLGLVVIGPWSSYIVEIGCSEIDEKRKDVVRPSDWKVEACNAVCSCNDLQRCRVLLLFCLNDTEDIPEKK